MSSPVSYPSLKRYTHFVKLSKFALSVTVIVLLVFVIALPLMDDDRNAMRVVFDADMPADAVATALPTMINPRFQSVDDSQQPYLVTADTAIQQQNENIALTNVEADLTTNDNAWLFLKSRTGLLNMAGKQLKLRDNIHINHSAGHEMNTAALDINLESFDMAGNSPVQIQGPFGHIKAGQFTITNRGDRLLFTNHVYMLLYPQ